MEDERLTNILNQRDQAIQQSDNVYQDLITNNQNLYNQQTDYVNKYEEEQNKIAQGEYEQTQNLINQNKEQARKETDIENQKAYNSYQKLINPYGTDVESLGGLNNSGFSETFKLGAYNQYQDRRGKANDALRQAITQYDNDMLEAKKTYDVAKAQNALAKLQMGLEYAQSYNNTNNELSLGKLNASQGLNTEYDNRYTNMVNQINTEKQLAEQIRQFNEQMAYQKERDAIEDARYSSSYSGGGGGYDLTDNYSVNTAYYQGDLNADANRYGTFSNGYQPKGISGHGTLSESGDEVTFNTQTLSGQNQTVTQNIWVAEDGTRWYWDGRYNKYLSAK